MVTFENPALRLSKKHGHPLRDGALNCIAYCRTPRKKASQLSMKTNTPRDSKRRPSLVRKARCLGAHVAHGHFVKTASTIPTCSTRSDPGVSHHRGSARASINGRWPQDTHTRTRHRFCRPRRDEHGYYSTAHSPRGGRSPTRAVAPAMGWA